MNNFRCGALAGEHVEKTGDASEPEELAILRPDQQGTEQGPGQPLEAAKPVRPPHTNSNRTTEGLWMRAGCVRFDLSAWQMPFWVGVPSARQPIFGVPFTRYWDRPAYGDGNNFCIRRPGAKRLAGQ